eukprot:1724470-Alexandrium_andersonii.AAC.1
MLGLQPAWPGPVTNQRTFHRVCNHDIANSQIRNPQYPQFFGRWCAREPGHVPDTIGTDLLV